MSNYFSDRELGPKARIQQEISPVVWAGLVVMVQALLDTSSFGASFPDRCHDGAQTVGNDAAAMGAAVAAEIDGLVWPLETHRYGEETGWERKAIAPPTMVVLDFLEFVWRHVGTPHQGSYHKFFDHYHLSFDAFSGRANLCEDVNRVFARNGVAYELGTDGQIRRLMPAVLGEALTRTYFNTGDRTLDVMLEESRVKFSSPDPLIRREALERLFDSWERIKTLAVPDDKKRSIGLILDQSAREPAIRELLEVEALALTRIGNSLLLRHHEVTQTPVIDVDHVDYLYHRLFAIVDLVNRKSTTR